MPTYQYRCTDCGRELEAVQKFTDPSLTECPTCQGALRKVFNAVGVVFKGSGFYRTDSRGTSASEKAESNGSEAAKGEKANKDANGNKGDKGDKGGREVTAGSSSGDRAAARNGTANGGALESASTSSSSSKEKVGTGSGSSGSGSSTGSGAKT